MRQGVLAVWLACLLVAARLHQAQAARSQCTAVQPVCLWPPPGSSAPAGPFTPPAVDIQPAASAFAPPAAAAPAPVPAPLVTTPQAAPAVPVAPPTGAASQNAVANAANGASLSAADRNALTNQLLSQMYGAGKERAAAFGASAVPQRQLYVESAPLLPVEDQLSIFDRLSRLVKEQDEEEERRRKGATATAADGGAGGASRSPKQHRGPAGGARRRRRLRALLQAQTPSDLVQRVQAAAATPQLTPAQQQAIFTNLLISALRDQPPPKTPSGNARPTAPSPAPAPSRPLPPQSGASGGGGASGSARPNSAAVPNAQRAANKAVVRVVNAEYGVVAAVNDVGVANERGQPQGQLLQDLTFLRNAALTVGVDVPRGGVVGEISSPMMPPPFTNRNLINVWDCGRLMQQSYYGCDDGSCWAAKAWRWNPVQCGSWQNHPARLLTSSMDGTPPSRVLTQSQPRNWGGGELLDDVTMTSDYSLSPDYMTASYGMTYGGPTPQPPRTQETPAFFVDRRLSVLAFYEGATPWTNGNLRFTMPGGTNNYFTPTERWAAYVEPTSGYGIGVFNPASSGLVAYRIGPDNSTRVSDTSYLALTTRFSIEPGATYRYKAYVAVGRIGDIRRTFARIAAELGVAGAAPGTAAGAGAGAPVRLLEATNAGAPLAAGDAPLAAGGAPLATGGAPLAVGGGGSGAEPAAPVGGAVAAPKDGGEDDGDKASSAVATPVAADGVDEAGAAPIPVTAAPPAVVPSVAPSTFSPTPSEGLGGVVANGGMVMTLETALASRGVNSTAIDARGTPLLANGGPPPAQQPRPAAPKAPPLAGDGPAAPRASPPTAPRTSTFSRPGGTFGSRAAAGAGAGGAAFGGAPSGSWKRQQVAPAGSPKPLSGPSAFQAPQAAPARPAAAPKTQPPAGPASSPRPLRSGFASFFSRPQQQAGPGASPRPQQQAGPGASPRPQQQAGPGADPKPLGSVAVASIDAPEPSDGPSDTPGAPVPAPRRASGTFGAAPKRAGALGAGPRATGTFGAAPRATGTFGAAPRATGTFGAGPRVTGTFGAGPRTTGTFGSRPMGPMGGVPAPAPSMAARPATWAPADGDGPPPPPVAPSPVNSPMDESQVLPGRAPAPKLAPSSTFGRQRPAGAPAPAPAAAAPPKQPAPGAPAQGAVPRLPGLPRGPWMGMRGAVAAPRRGASPRPGGEVALGTAGALAAPEVPGDEPGASPGPRFVQDTFGRRPQGAPAPQARAAPQSASDGAALEAGAAGGGGPPVAGYAQQRYGSGTVPRRPAGWWDPPGPSVPADRAVGGGAAPLAEGLGGAAVGGSAGAAGGRPRQQAGSHRTFSSSRRRQAVSPSPGPLRRLLGL